MFQTQVSSWAVLWLSLSPSSCWSSPSSWSSDDWPGQYLFLIVFVVLLLLLLLLLVCSSPSASSSWEVCNFNTDGFDTLVPARLIFQSTKCDRIFSVRVFVLHAHTHGGPRFVIFSEGLLVVLTEHDSREISRQAQSLARNGHPSTDLVTVTHLLMWWRRLLELSSAFESEYFGYAFVHVLKIILCLSLF